MNKNKNLYEVGKILPSKSSLNKDIHLSLPVNHFLLLQLIQKNPLGIEFKTIISQLQQYSPVFLARLGLNRSENALYHVLSRMINQDLICSINRGFHLPAQYQITSSGKEYLEDIWKFMSQEKLIALENIDTNQDKSKGRQIYPENMAPTKNNQIEKAKKRWITVLNDFFYQADENNDPKFTTKLDNYCQRILPKVRLVKNEISRQEQIQSSIIDEFGEKFTHVLDPTTMPELIQKLVKIIKEEVEAE